MNVLMIANVDLISTEGIFKKIHAQAQALSKVYGHGWALTKRSNHSQLRDLQLDETIQLEQNVINAIVPTIKRLEIKRVYIRHMIPSPGLLFSLKAIKRMGVKIFYEIPTYPYFFEQYKTAKYKIKAIVKILLDIAFFPFIYHYIDALVVIKSNSRVKVFKKMIEIYNGADIDSIAIKNKRKTNKDVISLVTVGTFYNYHGYDRILRGLQRYNESNRPTKIVFNLIGESSYTDYLKTLAQKLDLNNVFFLGKKNNDELNKLFDSFDLGISSVGLYRRNADIDTTIKLIEYYCRGIPVVTSGISPLDHIDDRTTIHVPNNNAPIDFDYIIQQYNKITDESIDHARQLSRERFSWLGIMTEIWKRVDCNLQDIPYI